MKNLGTTTVEELREIDMSHKSFYVQIFYGAEFSSIFDIIEIAKFDYGCYAIVHLDGKRYFLESLEELFTMVIKP